MELRVSSEIDGVVTTVNCRAGETVERNAVIVIVEPEHVN
jgi:3-methylcrotonyl-CoA carboxylase alpha subunit